MFERSPFWSAPPVWSSASIERAGLRITAIEAPALLLSGAMDVWLSRRELRCLGPREICDATGYALRLAPDTVLFVGAADIAPGWHAEEQLAVSDAGDAWVLIDVLGERATDVMAQGSELALATVAGPAGESARLLFAGMVVAVSRRPAGWRLHVDRAWAPALWRWLEVHADAAAS